MCVLSQYTECRSSSEKPASIQPDFKEICKNIKSMPYIFIKGFHLGNTVIFS